VRRRQVAILLALAAAVTACMCTLCCGWFILTPASPSYCATKTARSVSWATESARPTDTTAPAGTPAESTHTPSATDTPTPTRTPSPADTPTIVPSPTATRAPTDTPTPIDTPTIIPSPTPTVLDAACIEGLVRDALGPGNRDVPRLTNIVVDMETSSVAVTWAVNDNLTEGLIKDGLWLDVAEVASALTGSPYHVRYLRMLGSFSMVDVYGNTSETQVVNVAFEENTLYCANWDAIDSHNIYLIADSLYLHPAFAW
jgi:hypothetical protein